MATQYINNVESKQDKSIDYKFTKCTYCRKSTLDEIHPTKWVMCDICDCWVHQKCVSDIDQSYSGDFICKYCNTKLNDLETLPNEQIRYDKFQKECNTFLKKLEMSIEDRQ